MTKAFVGFDTLEKLLDAVDPKKPINAVPIINPGSGGKYGICLCVQEIVISQIQGDEILYCNIVVGRYQAIVGETKPLDVGDTYQRRSESAWIIIKTVLQERELIVREALIAEPRNLKMLDGWADCLHYNKETDLFERTQPENA